MILIYPDRLKTLRKRTFGSRRELAAASNLSERQIGRLETGVPPVQVREDTLRKLADALSVPGAVLTGAAPLPAGDGTGAGAAHIDPVLLRKARSALGMTRARLHEKSGVSERTISRLESSRKPVRDSTADRLARALGVERSELENGSSTLPTGLQPLADPAPQLKLAFDLVTHRYGPSRREIVTLAPLLFTILAEGCLAWRRDRLEKAREAMGEMDGLAARNHQLYFLRYLAKIEQGVALEQESIDDHDVLGRTVWDDDDAHVAFDEDDLFAVTPFADYLRMLADNLDEGVVDFALADSEATVGGDYLDIWGADPYQVCAKTLDELCGGSKDARSALANGDVRISAIPRHLLEPDATTDRVSWLGGRLSDSAREREKAREALLKSVDIRLGEPGGTNVRESNASGLNDDS